MNPKTNMQQRLESLEERLAERAEARKKSPLLKEMESLVGARNASNKITFSEEDRDLTGIPWSTSRGYARKGGVYAHVFVLFRMGLHPSGDNVTDHINGNKMDNRRANLRIVSRKENRRNQHKCLSKTGFIGVTKTSSGFAKWEARLQAKIDGKKVFLFRKRFHDPVEAARAYDKAAKSHGFSTCNFSEDQ